MARERGGDGQGEGKRDSTAHGGAQVQRLVAGRDRGEPPRTG